MCAEENGLILMVFEWHLLCGRWGLRWSQEKGNDNDIKVCYRIGRLHNFYAIDCKEMQRNNTCKREKECVWVRGGYCTVYSGHSCAMRRFINSAFWPWIGNPLSLRAAFILSGLWIIIKQIQIKWKSVTRNETLIKI